MSKKLSALLFGIVAFSLMTQSALAGLMLFVGDGCPHCAIVEKYMEDYDVALKMPIQVYEVWYNESNRNLYKKVAAEVGYTGGAVPFLVNGKEYKVGDTPITSYFDDIITGKVKVTQDAAASTVVKEEPKAEENSGYASVINVEEEPVSNTLSEEDSKELNKNLGKDVFTPPWYQENIRALIGGALIIIAVGATIVIVLKKKK